MKILCCLWLLLFCLAAQGRITGCDELVQLASSTSGTRSERLANLALEMLDQPYAAGTLGGGPEVQEIFSPRCDSLDCMTLLEVLLAASSLNESSTLEDWADSLRHLRYASGDIAWASRHHFFTEWLGAGHATDLGALQAASRATELKLNQREEDSLWLEGVTPKHSHVAVIEHDLLDRSSIRSGDLVGFRASQAGLDVTHTGLLVWQAGELMLVHASSNQGRVVMEPLSDYAGRKKGLVILRLP